MYVCMCVCMCACACVCVCVCVCMCVCVCLWVSGTERLREKERFGMWVSSLLSSSLLSLPSFISSAADVSETSHNCRTPQRPSSNRTATLKFPEMCASGRRCQVERQRRSGAPCSLSQPSQGRSKRQRVQSGGGCGPLWSHCAALCGECGDECKRERREKREREEICPY